MSREKSLVHNILFSKKKCRYEDFENIDLENVIKITSSHLVIPPFYLKIVKNNYTKYFPVEFINYLEEIFEINKNRKKILLEELNKIDKILHPFKGKYIFIKGAYLLRNKFYTNFGERMVGDIDFLVKENKFNSVVEILHKNKFKSEYLLKFRKSNHYPRLINEKFFFGLEPHNNILKKHNNLINLDKLFGNKKSELQCELIKIIILNSEINDHGHFFANYNYRTIYDIFLFEEKIINNINEKENKYLRRFFLKTNIIGLTSNKIILNFWDKLYKRRFKLKNNNKLYRKTDEFFCRSFQKIYLLDKKIIEFLFNKSYRKKIIKFYYR